MSRNQEYWDLVSTLGETPAALDTSVERARAKRRKFKLGKWLGVPVATLGGLASAFVLLVNFSIPFAMACKEVPFLRQMAAAAALDPTLKEAVENDYYQYVGQTQTVDGVTMTVHYLVLDQSELNIFYTVDSGPAEGYRISGDHGANGLEVIQGGYSSGSSDAATGGGMESIALGFTTEFSLPEVFPLRLQVHPHEVRDDTAAPDAASGDPYHSPRDERPPAARFAFDIPLDARFTQPPRLVEVDRWFQVDGQHFLVETIELYPLTTKLTLSAHPDNTMVLEGFDLHLTDGTGAVYDRSGLTGYGEMTYLTGSVYFADPSGVTLCITGARWSPKGGGYAELDLDSGQAVGLPDWAQVEQVARTGEDVRLAIRYTGPVSPLISMTYCDPQGGEHSAGGMSTSTGPDDQAVDFLVLEDYPWDTVRLPLGYTHYTQFAAPLTVPLT